MKTTVKCILFLLISCVFFSSLVCSQEPLTEEEMEKAYQELKNQYKILGIDVTKESNSEYSVEVEYEFSGERTLASIYIAPIEKPEDVDGYQGFNRVLENYHVTVVRPGKNKVKVKLRNPQIMGLNWDYTNYLVAGIYDHDRLLANKFIKYSIDWPNSRAQAFQEMLSQTPIENLFQEAVKLVDDGNRDRREMAKKYLENIIVREPTYDPAYIEMARIEMKSSWNREGLKRAENLLDSALSINSKNPNTYVLIGYVYTHQGRFDEAEKAFAKAKNIGTENIWLWTNWGILETFKDDIEAAKKMYKVAIDVQRPFNTYDRAQLDAYNKIIKLYDEKQESDKLKEIFSKRIKDYGKNPCFKSEYAVFMVRSLGDYRNSQKTVREAMAEGCDSAINKKALGLASYFEWFESSAEKKSGLLAQAKLFYPAGAELFYDLARSVATDDQVENIVEQSGESIDKVNSNEYSALALALYANDYDSSERLLNLGASIDKSIGFQEFPISFIPITLSNYKMVEMIIAKGFDYKKVSFSGISAAQFSEQFQNPSIINLLKGIDGA